MAFSLMPGGVDPEASEMAEINVTPLVDVMLVLLIIFMITAPMLHPGIEVQLPEAEAKNLPLRVEDPLVISIRENGMVYVQEQPIHPTQLVDRLLPILEARGDDSLYVKADRNLPYGNVMEILDLLNSGGIQQVGMVTQPRRQTS